MQYGQFCPVAKAAELLGERWTLLIVRELVFGATRFSEMQRALSHISPTMLTRRLKELEQGGLVVRRKVEGQKSTSYFLTEAGRELAPIIDGLAEWGMRWVRGRASDQELDLEMLFSYVGKTLDMTALPDGETVLQFSFKDVDGMDKWWLICSNGDVDVCTDDPGRDVNLYITTDARTLIECWMGDLSLSSAVRSEKISLIGEKHLSNTFTKWFGLYPNAHVRPVKSLAS